MLKLVVLSLIVSLSFAISESEIKQGALFQGQSKQVVGQTFLGRAILQFVELKDRLSNFDFGKLFVALDELQESIQGRIQEENTLLASDRGQYVSDQSYYSNQVTQYLNEAAGHKTNSKQLEDERVSLEGTLSQKDQELTKSNQLQNGIEETMNSNNELFKSNTQDYDNAVQIIDQVLEILSQADGETNSNVQNSLTQLSQSLHEKLTYLKSGSRIFMQPLVSSLISIASNKFSDQQLLQDVQKLLNDLRASLIQSKQSQINDYQNERAINQQILDAYNQKLDSLENEVIPQLKDSLLQVNGEIVSVSQLLNDSNGNLLDAQANVEQLEERWITRQSLNRGLSNEYNNELQIIAESLTALERGGVKRQ